MAEPFKIPRKPPQLADVNLTTKPPLRRLFSIREAAAYLAVSKREMQYMLKRGDLPSISQGRRRRLDIRDLDAWIERQRQR